MSSDWKRMIGQWYQWQNKRMVEDVGDPDDYWFQHELLWKREKERWDRIRVLQKDRKLTPTKYETKLRPFIIKDLGGELSVRLEVESCLTYTINGEIHQEERQEVRGLILQKSSRGWKLKQDNGGLEGQSFSQRDMPVWNSTPAPPPERERRFRSLPLMNQRMLQGQTRDPRQNAYQRQQAVRYADAWWNERNPKYRAFDVDCTNYISQCLHAGGAPMTAVGRRDRGWWYRQAGGSADQWSYSWAVAHSLRWYLPSSQTGLRATTVSSARDLKLGDVICYDFNGDGRWQHNTIVTAFDSNGEPLVNAHTTNSRHRYWDYRDSYAYTDQTKYQFFQIADYF